MHLTMSIAHPYLQQPLSHQSEIQHQERVSYLSDSGPIESPDITSVRCTLVTLTLPLVLIAVTIDIFVILLDSYKYTYRNPIKSGIIIMNVPCHWWFLQIAHLNILRVWMRHSDLLGHWVWGAEQYMHEGSFWARSRCGSANRVQRGVKVSGLVHTHHQVPGYGVTDGGTHCPVLNGRPSLSPSR